MVRYIIPNINTQLLRRKNSIDLEGHCVLVTIVFLTRVFIIMFFLPIVFMSLIVITVVFIAMVFLQSR